ncbi:MAG: Ig-like domain repeat protein [Edaphobacter sp.]
MSTYLMQHSERRSRYSRALAILSLMVLSLHPALHAQRIPLAVRTVDGTAADAGPVPASQPLQLTLRLALPADRSAALDELLANQTTPHSTAYHQWLTPQQFASQFGATDDQIAATTSWLQTQGLSVDAIATSRTRMTISGTAAQVQSTFAVTLHRYQVANALYVANANQPSLPSEAAHLIAGVSGLNNLPAAALLAAAISAGPTANIRSANPTQPTDPYLNAASAVEANTSPILTFDTTACTSDFAQSDYDGYHDLLRQANAQGITVLATNGCGARGTGSFPASLGEVTALTIAPTTAPFTPIAPRPAWQNAPGLPADANRYEPDLTTTSLSAFAQTITTIIQQTGARQGNINAVLYSLAPTPELYKQPEATSSTAPGTWKPATGLGVVDLATLLKVYPRAVGTTSTTTTLAASSTSVAFGQPVTLTSTVTPSTTNNATPTGTIIFTSNLGTLGSAVLNGGTAAVTPGNLSVGTYTVVANYSGDANYAASSSASTTINVGKFPATISVTSNITSSGVLAGANVILSATVSGAGNTTTGPTGSVAFFDNYNGNAVPLGTGGLTTNGLSQSIATFSTTGLGAGTHSIYAVYNGDTNFGTAASSPITLTFADYNLTMVPQTLTLNVGKSGQAVVLVGAIAGFNGTITFGCTPPANTETTCSFSPSSLSGGGSTTLTITTTAPVTGSVRRGALEDLRRRMGNAASGAVLAMMLCGIFARRRRLLPTLLVLFCAAALASSMGCNPATAGQPDPAAPSSDPGSPLGTQMFSITSAGSNGVSTVRHNYQYQVTIQ